MFALFLLAYSRYLCMNCYKTLEFLDFLFQYFTDFSLCMLEIILNELLVFETKNTNILSEEKQKFSDIN